MREREQNTDEMELVRQARTHYYSYKSFIAQESRQLNDDDDESVTVQESSLSSFSRSTSGFGSRLSSVSSDMVEKEEES